MSRLAGRVALVTGGAAGIGRAAAERFAAEGAAVMVVDVDGTAARAVASGLAAGGARAAAYTADVAQALQVEAMVDATIDRFGALDVLMNNAGIGRLTPLAALAPDTWDAIQATNLRGAYLACRAAAPHLGRSGRGVILNVASQAGLEGQAQNAAYCASKAGVILLTRALARELAPEVRVNCLCPGGTDTALLRGYLGGGATAEAALPGLAARLPLGRVARPDEIAAAALFLVSDAAAYVTGVALPVDGGATA